MTNSARRRAAVAAAASGGLIAAASIAVLARRYGVVPTMVVVWGSSFLAVLGVFRYDEARHAASRAADLATSVPPESSGTIDLGATTAVSGDSDAGAPERRGKLQHRRQRRRAHETLRAGG